MTALDLDEQAFLELHTATPKDAEMIIAIGRVYLLDGCRVRVTAIPHGAPHVHVVDAEAPNGFRQVSIDRLRPTDREAEARP